MAGTHDNPRPPNPDEVVDAFFDRSLEEGSRERFFASLRRDLRQCEQVARTQRALSMLRGPVDCPDLTNRIMSRIERRRAFLPARLRSMVTGGRMLVAASLLLGLAGIFAIQRYAPEAVELTSAPRPVTRLLDSGKEGASESVRDLAGALRTVRAEAVPLARFGDLAIRGVSRPAPPTLSTGPLTSIRVLSADEPESGLRLTRGAESAAGLGADRFFLTCSPMSALPRPTTSAWIWAGGPGRTLEDSLSMFPNATDPSANPLWPAVDPLLVEIAKPKSVKP
ncbi:MAG: hypothetical protein IT437_12920 [Phycisphaerales bacterium]|nr:hypothetical protein [Phycisphaerales bacterium]